MALHLIPAGNDSDESQNRIHYTIELDNAHGSTHLRYRILRKHKGFTPELIATAFTRRDAELIIMALHAFRE